MTRTIDRDAHLHAFSHAQNGERLPEIPWLRRLAREAREEFQTAGFPKPRDEEWRFTNLAPLIHTRFQPARPTILAADALAGLTYGDQVAAELVFVNGTYSPGLSRVREEDGSIRISTLDEALAEDPAGIEKHLGRHADITRNPFIALNTGLFQNGTVIRIAAGRGLDQPIHLLFISSTGTQAMAIHPRLLIIAEAESHAQIIETYCGSGQDVYLMNPVMEIAVGERAAVERTKVQNEGLHAFHIGALQADLERGAKLVSHTLNFGGALVRNDLNVRLNGAGAEAMLNGAMMIDGHQHVDNHTLLDHAAPNCPSHELYKAVLAGSASGVFKGKILVRPDAQKTDSKQTSKTLLLSDDAVMNSQPTLEIFADDVKCTHGSTTGPLDEEQIFYLQSRGIELDAARHLLTYAFLAEVTSRLTFTPLRLRVEAWVASRHGLPEDLPISTDAAR